MVKTNKIAVSKVDPNYVPKDLGDLVRVYYSHVGRLVSRLNKVPTNFDDLLQHIFYELCRVDIVNKFTNPTGDSSLLSADQAALYCGMKLPAFISAVRTAVSTSTQPGQAKPTKPLSKAKKDEVFTKVGGVCHACSKDLPKFLAGLKHYQKTDQPKYRKTRIYFQEKFSISTRVRNFWTTETTATGETGVVCLFCLNTRDSIPKLTQPEVILEPSKNGAPRPVKGTASSRKALYRREDVELFRKVRASKGIPIPPEDLDLTPSKRGSFQAYLTTCVKNIFANWCRTRSRRWKDLYKAPLEDGQSWESQFADNSHISPDTLIEINQQASEELGEFLSKTRRNGTKLIPSQVYELRAAGRTLSEVASACSVSYTRKPKK